MKKLLAICTIFYITPVLSSQSSLSSTGWKVINATTNALYNAGVSVANGSMTGVKTTGSAFSWTARAAVNGIKNSLVLSKSGMTVAGNCALPAACIAAAYYATQPRFFEHRCNKPMSIAPKDGVEKYQSGNFDLLSKDRISGFSGADMLVDGIRDYKVKEGQNEQIINLNESWNNSLPADYIDFAQKGFLYSAMGASSAAILAQCTGFKTVANHAMIGTACSFGFAGLCTAARYYKNSSIQHHKKYAPAPQDGQDEGSCCQTFEQKFNQDHKTILDTIKRLQADYAQEYAEALRTAQQNLDRVKKEPTMDALRIKRDANEKQLNILRQIVPLPTEKEAIVNQASQGVTQIASLYAAVSGRFWFPLICAWLIIRSHGPQLSPVHQARNSELNAAWWTNLFALAGAASSRFVPRDYQPIVQKAITSSIERNEQSIASQEAHRTLAMEGIEQKKEQELHRLKEMHAGSIAVAEQVITDLPATMAKKYLPLLCQELKKLTPGNSLDALDQYIPGLSVHVERLIQEAA